MNAEPSKTSTVTPISRRIAGRILVIDPDAAVRASFEDTLRRSSLSVDLARDVAEGLTVLKTSTADLIFLGVSRDDTAQVLSELQESYPTVPVVTLVDGNGQLVGLADIEWGGVSALARNAPPEEIVAVATSAIELSRVRHANVRLMRSVEEARLRGGPVGHSPAFREMMERAQDLATGPAAPLLVGLEGTGKRLLARSIHEQSPRAGGPLLVLSAESLSPDALDILLGTTCNSTDGTARDGSVLIRQIEKLPVGTQSRLTEFLRSAAEDDAFAARTARVLAASCAHIDALAEEGLFAAELLDCFAAGRIDVPSLAERRADIPQLATFFLDQAAGEAGHHGFTLEALLLLEVCPWRGNLAELKEVVERAWSLAAGKPVGRQHLVGKQGPLEILAADAQDLDEIRDRNTHEVDVLPFELEEKRILGRALEATDGNVTRAAQLLRIGRATLYRKIHQYGLRDLKSRRTS